MENPQKIDDLGIPPIYGTPHMISAYFFRLKSILFDKATAGTFSGSLAEAELWPSGRRMGTTPGIYSLDMEVSINEGTPKGWFDGFIREDAHLEMDDLGLPLF